MNRRWFFLVLGAAACAALPFVTAAASADDASNAEIASRLQKIISGPILGGGKVGMLVVREADGSVVYSHNSNRPMIPASNMKVLTSIAALERFGPSHQFQTGVFASTPLDGDGRVDDLIVVGGGDPVLNSEDWWRLASELRAAGLREVRGDIFVDDSRFDDSRWHPSWGAVSARAYHAPVGALSANYGAFFVGVKVGSKPGDPVQIEVSPPIDYLRIRNLAATGTSRARRRLFVDRAPPSPEGEPGVHEVVRVHGVMRAGDSEKHFPRSVLDPGLYAGSVLKMQLEAVGIGVAGRVRRGRLPEGTTELIEFDGRSLSEIVKLFVKYSNNAIAETLIKNLGAERAGGDGKGSWSTGIPELRAVLESIGLDLDGIKLVDGSGLSVHNRLSAKLLVDALRHASRRFDYGPELLSALPIANLDGTLEDRVDGAPGEVRAKTGLLSDARVTALSGFAHGRGGDRLVFSILVNGHRGGSRDAMDAVDALAEALVDGEAGSVHTAMSPES